MIGRDLVETIRQKCVHTLSYLYMDCVFDAEDQIGIVDLFRDLATVSQQQAIANENSAVGIKHLVLLHCGFDMDEILDSIAEINTLKQLDLQDCELSAGTMDAFFEKLVKRESPIHRISLDYVTGITDTTLQYINALPRLKEVSFWCLADITNDGIQLLRDNRRISKLVVCECEQCEQVTL
ncbi:hypothetical protein BDB00DRAFT_805741, partial [Zychaea mexicana]|uniref:uncharacterized protein n=1 Tax=Zychaea mexicana TaxID=64656 RepID=UPI0022FEE678